MQYIWKNVSHGGSRSRHNSNASSSAIGNSVISDVAANALSGNIQLSNSGIDHAALPQPDTHKAPQIRIHNVADYNYGYVKYSANNTLDLQNFPRILEKTFGESLGNRSSVLNALAVGKCLSIGLPDLLHFTKIDRFYKNEVGEYLNITGIDFSNDVMPLSFLNILDSVSNSDAGGKGMETGNDKVRLMTFCCCNIFSDIDIRIRYESPKKYQVSAIDLHNPSLFVELDDDLWEETFVSCCIRSIIINEDKLWKSPGLVELPFLISEFKNAKRLVKSMCERLPLYYKAGFDSTKANDLTILHNNLTKALLKYLSIVSNDLNDYTIKILESLMVKDVQNNLIYQLVIIKILDQNEMNDIKLINLLNITIKELLNSVMKQKNKNDNLHLLNCTTEILIIQARFLMRRNDLEDALEVAKKVAALSSDSFESWFLLASIYVALEQYDNALYSINSIPSLPKYDKQQLNIISQKSVIDSNYKRPYGRKIDRNLGTVIPSGCDLNSAELDNLSKIHRNLKENELKCFIYGRTIMPFNDCKTPKSTYLDQSCSEIGPLYGVQSINLINFVSPNEVKTITNTQLLQRNSIVNQYSWFETQVMNILLDIVCKIGWNDLLKLRSTIFIMEKEYISNKQSNIGMIPKHMREKRLCERWLDQLFLDIYEDLTIVNENDIFKSSENINSDDHSSVGSIHNSLGTRKEIKYSGLEWELLGLTMLRTWNFEDAIICFRTSMLARFDIISCEKLLEIYFDEDNHNFKDLIYLNNINLILILLSQKIYYESRFYNYLQISNIKFMLILCRRFGNDLIKNKINLLESESNMDNQDNKRLMTSTLKLKEILQYASDILKEEEKDV
ncbi:hypothetical protein TPHA_0I00890 [Tetrapisispora phaffii CBS 4417]|uniref:Uncharacterized protein n=1 Tax=Tetrapisispora phaffii (strain ATCC 24235 / CBS 4417 / NBRC 1672 / NRRL Y-8282 / UCD 70-5) TaxID=1071381 RepID=G8BXG7_TETPH|nr:hypothetical protein TPHA_0I00890 [Tetrapisispora phaffii CBS 4417]CCE64595.1 hypothetical protein TPHA_0I00890 [Tetrapisispora phaffii CBS 4417]